MLTKVKLQAPFVLPKVELKGNFVLSNVELEGSFVGPKSNLHHRENSLAASSRQTKPCVQQGTVGSFSVLNSGLGPILAT